MDLDLLIVLNRYINSHKYFTRSFIGLLQATDSLSIMAMPGGRETVFQDGARDKDYQVQVNAKSQDQLTCINTLNDLAKKLERLDSLPSINGSYEFQEITITSLPSLIAQDEQGFYIYALSISATITIPKGVL